MAGSPLRLLVDSPSDHAHRAYRTPQAPRPVHLLSPGAPRFDAHCDVHCEHCGRTCEEMRAPLACGHSICDSQCTHWHQCPEPGTRQCHMLSFRGVLLELLGIVPAYDTD